MKPPANRSRTGREATQFKKGQSGNVSGRPKLPEPYKQAMESLEPLALEALREILVNKRHPRRQHAAEYVLNRIHGAPSTRMQLTGRDEGPLRLESDDPIARMLLRMIAQKNAAAAAESADTDQSSSNVGNQEPC